MKNKGEDRKIQIAEEVKPAGELKVAPTPKLTPDEAIDKTIAEVRAAPGQPLLTVEHVEHQSIQRLVEAGFDVDWATRAVRARLY